EAAGVELHEGVSTVDPELLKLGDALVHGDFHGLGVAQLKVSTLEYELLNGALAAGPPKTALRCGQFQSPGHGCFVFAEQRSAADKGGHGGVVPIKGFEF